MLEEIAIQNFALIESAILRFGPGLNVLTGETGAGKSIVQGAFSMILGGRAQTEWIREGEGTCSVEARFHFSPKSYGKTEIFKRLQTLGLLEDTEKWDGILIIRRSIAQDSSKNRIYINGHMATRTNLLELLQGFFDVSGQRENQVLLKTENHLLLLDFMMNQNELVTRFSELVEKLNHTFQTLEDLVHNQAALLQKQDYLSFQIKEIERIQPEPGEDEGLQAEIKKLGHVEELQKFSEQFLFQLDQSDHSVQQTLQSLSASLEKYCEMFERKGPLAKCR